MVATPIGNPEDLSPRGVRILKEVTLVAAEDTRLARRIFSSYGIHTPLVSLFEHNEKRRVPELVRRLERGETLALVSDAGTPLISDPGYRLVREAVGRGIRVVPVPGPSAVTAALSVAGLPTDHFVFVGFLPKKAGKRRKELETLAVLPYTLVFFESPHRVLRTLREIGEVMGQRPVVLCRELTKRYEEILRGTPDSLMETLEGRQVKGEVTLVVGGKEEP